MKKLLSILLVSLIIMSSLSVITSFAVTDSSKTKLTSSIENDTYYKKLQKVLNKQYKDMGFPIEEDIKITLYKKLSDKNVLFKYDLPEGSTVAAVVYDEYFGKYNYCVGSIDELAYIFDGNKIYDIKDAYNDDVINDKELDKTATLIKEIKVAKITVKAGEKNYLNSSFGKYKSIINRTYSNKNIATVDKYGDVIGLKKGKTAITATPKVGKKCTCKIVVTSNPKLSKKSVMIGRNKTANVDIIGKAESIDNIYTNTKFAKVISKKSDNTIKVKGLKKGTTTVKIKVNGVKTLKLNVKVS